MLSPLRTRLATGLALALMVGFWPAAWRFAAPALSPFLAICAPLAVRPVSFAALAGLPMLAWVAMRRRFWCRNLCPVGLIADSCGKLRRSPGAPSRYWPSGRWLALATLGGALAGYPLFLWLDPLALFGGFFSLGRVASPGVTPWAVAGLPLVMTISVLAPGLWCSRICPLGATQDILASAPQMWRGRNGLPAAMRGLARERRGFLAVGAGALLGSLVPKALAGRRRPLRPPGAVRETAFEGGCIRCGSCSRACPTRIIEPAVDRSDAGGFLAPRLVFQGAAYCRQDCNLCGRVCPTGVIRPLALAEKNRHVIGIAVVRQADCYLAIEKECGICVPRCPRAALVDVFSRETYQAVIQVVRERCNGCGACVGICPPKAITVESAAEAGPGHPAVRASA